VRKLTEDSLSIKFSDVDRANAGAGKGGTSANFMNQDEYLVKLGRNWDIGKHCRLNKSSKSASRQIWSLDISRICIMRPSFCRSSPPKEGGWDQDGIRS
jgi:hypothetical protein